MYSLIKEVSSFHPLLSIYMCILYSKNFLQRKTGEFGKSLVLTKFYHPNVNNISCHNKKFYLPKVYDGKFAKVFLQQQFTVYSIYTDGSVMGVWTSVLYMYNIRDGIKAEISFLNLC